MRILLANPRGFCAGVNMAIETLDRALDIFGKPLYVFHEIVHNRFVVERFKARGVTFVESIADVPVGSTLLYSAHGVAPDVRNLAARRGLKTIDATCPLVTKVHLEAVRFSKEGYQIVLIGHGGHEEVSGTLGEARESMVLVESTDDVERLNLTDTMKVAYLTQTTLSIDDASRIIDALKKRYPTVVGPPRDDICYATQNRQEAVKQLAERADVILVLGSQNSSNSRRLTEIAEGCGKRAYLIDEAKDIEAAWFLGTNTVAITAGASAPENVVQDCIGFLKSNYGATVEECWVREENVHFALPKEVRSIPPSPVENY